jgi:arylsulfatase A-like enzyme
MAQRVSMSRRGFLAAAGGVTAAACFNIGRAGAAGGGDRPHILLLMADQFRGDCLGADGHPVVKTPNLDALAGGGVRFSRAYSSTPTCTPARSALLTGLSPWHHGMLGMTKMAEKYPMEMPRVLAESDYHTTGIGKMHYHPQRNGHGFHDMILDESSRVETIDFRSDYLSWFLSEAPTLDYRATGIGWNDYTAKPYALPERLHPTTWMGNTAVKFLEGYDKANPFFLKVSFARPHSPYDPPERFWRMYEDTPIPPAVHADWSQKYAPRSGDKDDIWHGDMGEGAVRNARQGYYGNVTFVDEQIGRIMDALDKRGWLDNTLVVFTADHGDMTGDHFLWRKSYAYESSARIPMLLRAPKGMGGTPGQVCGRPTELRDVLPTFMDAAGVPGADKLDGRSLLALARDGAAPWREYIDMEHELCYDKTNCWNALTDGKRKYIFHAFEDSEQFFDLEADPMETRDLSGDSGHAGEVRTWRDRLISHFAERGEPFIRDGKLARRPKPVMHSPHFPGCSCHPNG